MLKKWCYDCRAEVIDLEMLSVSEVGKNMEVCG